MLHRLIALLVIVTTFASGQEYTQLRGKPNWVSGNLNYIWGITRNDDVVMSERPVSENSEWQEPGRQVQVNVNMHRPTKKRRPNCKKGQLFGQVPGKPSIEVCLNNPQEKQSMTQQKPITMFKQWKDRSTTSPATVNFNYPRDTILAKVYTIPIGQGDCNVISCNGGKNVILFDCGSKGGNEFKKIHRYRFLHGFFRYAESVTILISHGDTDHHNMIRKVFNTDFIKIPPRNMITVILGGNEADYRRDFLVWLRRIAANFHFQQGITLKNFCNNPDIWFQLAQGNLQARNKNEKGMLMKMSCKTCLSSLLFTGDMEGPTAINMATNPHYRNILRTTHYKMAHHGASNLANHPTWLAAIKPVEVHVSSMYNHGRYHHPRCEAIDRVQQYLGLAIGSPHAFTCFGPKGEPHDSWVYHRIYNTIPRRNTLCLIQLDFIAHRHATTRYFCGAPTDFVAN